MSRDAHISETYTNQGRVIDKRERYNWQSSGEPGSLQWIHKDALKIPSDTYQRDPENRKQMILRLARNFDWMAFGVLSVAERDGQLFVFDGAGRLSAARMRSDVSKVPCVVFTVQELRTEADAFRSSNTDRKGVAAYDKYRAALVARDPTALVVQKVIEGTGLRVVRSHPTDPWDLASIAWCMTVAARSESDLRRILETAGTVDRDSSLSKDLLQAIDYVYRNIGGHDVTRFESRIQSKHASELEKAIRRAKALYGGGGEKVCGYGLLEALNKGLRNKLEMKS